MIRNSSTTDVDLFYLSVDVSIYSLLTSWSRVTFPSESTFSIRNWLINWLEMQVSTKWQAAVHAGTPSARSTFTAARRRSQAGFSRLDIHNSIRLLPSASTYSLHFAVNGYRSHSTTFSWMYRNTPGISISNMLYRLYLVIYPVS